MDAIELNVGGHSQAQMSMAKHNDIRVDFRSSICNCLHTFVFQWDWSFGTKEQALSAHICAQQSHHQVLATRLQSAIGRNDPGILCMLLKVLYYHYRKLLSENANNASMQAQGFWCLHFLWRALSMLSSSSLGKSSSLLWVTHRRSSSLQQWHPQASLLSMTSCKNVCMRAKLLKAFKCWFLIPKHNCMRNSNL